MVSPVLPENPARVIEEGVSPSWQAGGESGKASPAPDRVPRHSAIHGVRMWSGGDRTRPSTNPRASSRTRLFGVPPLRQGASPPRDRVSAVGEGASGAVTQAANTRGDRAACAIGARSLIASRPRADRTLRRSGAAAPRDPALGLSAGRRNVLAFVNAMRVQEPAERRFVNASRAR